MNQLKRARVLRGLEEEILRLYAFWNHATQTFDQLNQTFDLTTKTFE
jgi:hypothetical protein